MTAPQPRTGPGDFGPSAERETSSDQVVGKLLPELVSPLATRLRALAGEWFACAEELPRMAAALADAYPDFPVRAAGRAQSLDECARELLEVLAETEGT